METGFPVVCTENCLLLHVLYSGVLTRLYLFLAGLCFHSINIFGRIKFQSSSEDPAVTFLPSGRFMVVVVSSVVITRRFLMGMDCYNQSCHTHKML